MCRVMAMSCLQSTGKAVHGCDSPSASGRAGPADGSACACVCVCVCVREREREEKRSMHAHVMSARGCVEADVHRFN